MMTIRNPETALLVHGLLEWLALAAGAWLYRRERRQRQQGSLLQGEGFRLAVGCLLGPPWATSWCSGSNSPSWPHR